MVLLLYFIPLVFTLECFQDVITIHREKLGDRCISQAGEKFYTNSDLKQIESFSVQTDFLRFQISPKMRNLREISVEGSENEVYFDFPKNSKIIKMKLKNVSNVDYLLRNGTLQNLRSFDLSDCKNTSELDYSNFKKLDKFTATENKWEKVPSLPKSVLALNISFNPFIQIEANDFDKLYNTLILIMRNCSIESLGKNKEHL
jgi:hypothetical protein